MTDQDIWECAATLSEKISKDASAQEILAKVPAAERHQMIIAMALTHFIEASQLEIGEVSSNTETLQ